MVAAARNNPSTNKEALIVLFWIFIFFGLITIYSCIDGWRSWPSWIKKVCCEILNENEPPAAAAAAGRQARGIQQVSAESAAALSSVFTVQTGRSGAGCPGEPRMNTLQPMGGVVGRENQTHSRENGNSRIGPGAPRMSPRSLYQPPPITSSSTASTDIAATHAIAAAAARQNIIIGAELRSSREGPNSSRQNQRHREADLLPSYDQFAPPTYHESLYIMYS